jgi:bacteriocin-like protein
LISSRRTIQESAMTTPKKDSPEKAKSAPKATAGIGAETNKGKAELSDDDLKKVTGGSRRKVNNETV